MVGFFLKVYIAAPFGSMATSIPHRIYGEITDSEYISFLETIEEVAKERGLETHLPHRDTNQWGKSYHTPKYITKMNWNAVQSSDLLIVYPQRSRGVHVEIGWGSATGKDLIILLNENEESSDVVEGLSALTNIMTIRFNTIKDLKEKLNKAIIEIMDAINS